MIDSLADLNTHHIQGFTAHGNHEFNVPLYSQIRGDLWTGGCPVGRCPREFRFVVCLYPWGEYGVDSSCSYTRVRLYDSEDLPDVRLLRALGRYVAAVSQIGPTLVHCQAGLNRSGLVAGLALVELGLNPHDAVDLLREKRCSAVLCNRAFEDYLLSLEGAPPT